MELCELIIEVIDQTYARGRYGEFDIVMTRSDCFINATKLCAAGGKQFKNWLRNASSEELIQAVQTELKPSAQIRADGPLAQIRADDRVTRTITGGNNVEVRGTYVHPLLIPHIACWVSPAFAIKVSKLVNEAMVCEYREKLRVKDELIDRLAAMLTKLQKATDVTGLRVEGLVEEVGGMRKQNDTLVEEVGGMRKQNKVLTSVVRGVQKQNEALTSEVRGVREQNEILIDTATEVLASVNELQDLALATAKDAVTRPDDSSKEERFALLAVTDELKRRRLCIVRCQARTLATQVASRRRQAQAEARLRAQKEAKKRDLDERKVQQLQSLAAGRVRVDTVFALACVPNARHLWTRVQEEAGDKIKTSGSASTFIELVDITEDEFEALARRLHEEPQTDCRATAESVHYAAQQAVQVAVGPVYVTNNILIVSETPSSDMSKLSNEDVDEVMADLF